MRHALALAARGLGQVWPNPAVGCVIVQGGRIVGGGVGQIGDMTVGRIVGRGVTQPGGRPHAEPVALAQAGDAALGATAFVTLEPCAHHAQTPPCTGALIAAGVARVVTALTDPDLRVSGQGHAQLRAAGIAVSEGVLADEARDLNRGFIKRATRGLPMLTLKLATSLDGRIATSSGESRWITGPVARRAVHAMRLRHDAVMVGAGTARADDPDLSVRDLGAVRQPVRIVIDSRLACAPDSRLGQSAGQSPVWLVHTPSAPAAARAAWAQTGAMLIEVPASGGHVDLRAALQKLAALGLTRILCEGGAALAAALVREALVDEIAVFSAGLMIGSEGRPALGALSVDTLANAPRLTRVSHQSTGADTLTIWRF